MQQASGLRLPTTLSAANEDCKIIQFAPPAISPATPASERLNVRDVICCSWNRTLGLLTLLACALPAAAGSLPATVPTLPEANTFRANFEIEVRRSMFKAKRQVDVQVDLVGDRGTVSLTFNKPVKHSMGVKQVLFSVHLTEGDEVFETVTIEIPDGATDVEFPVAFPGAGEYALCLSRTDVKMKPAKVKFPEGPVRVDIIVPANAV